MTKRHSALLSAAAVLATLTGTAAPAQAAIPDVGRTWAALMQRSLTEAAQLRSTAATQQTAFAAKVTALAAAKTANASAQARLTAAIGADATARNRHEAAMVALTKAKTNLTTASKRKPANRAAVTKAKNAVTAATTTAKARKAAAQQAATAVQTTLAGAQAAATGLDTAITAWKNANFAVRLTQQKLVAARSPNGLSAQAAALSRDVVTQARTTFTVADTTAVYGVTVHKIVAPSFKRMIDDARADGVVLSGGGFRTSQRQAELRKINGCPDIWTAPSTSCRVPTAIPGRSLHELGLAVDVTSGGKSLTAKSPGFTWLTLHADEYGFVNLPSEPWHWSITGG